MKINVYYGGRGVVDDPTLFALEKVEGVLRELNVSVTRYNLEEYKTNISTLPNTLKEADGVILATTLEWYGIGGYMQQFLDVCWLYADKEHIKKLYMYPLVMAKTYGEREAKGTLMTAWELLGGIPMEGLCAYVDDHLEFELNKAYVDILENSAENIYRTVSKKLVQLPTSNGVIKKSVIKEAMNLTPKESEQLSKYVANEEYVQTQKKDIEELSSLFKDLLSEADNGGDEYYTKPFVKHFSNPDGVVMDIQINILNKNKNIALRVLGSSVNSSIGSIDNPDVTVKMNGDTFDEIINGRKTFQRAFMAGEITAKGEFTKVRKLDMIFAF